MLRRVVMGVAVTAAFVLGSGAANAQNWTANWTGGYAGVSIGGNWSQSNATFSNLPTPIAGGGDGSYSIPTDGTSGGVLAGYNFQAGHLVLGFETDYSWLAHQVGGRAITLSKAQQGANGFSEYVTNETDYVGTLRGRVGYTFGNVLAYGTAGFAYSQTEGGYTVANNTSTGSSYTATDRTHGTGWVIGGGLEWAFHPKWTLRGEYQYVDLGSSTLSVPGRTVNGVTFGNTSTKFENTTDSVRGALVYKF